MTPDDRDKELPAGGEEACAGPWPRKRLTEEDLLASGRLKTIWEKHKTEHHMSQQQLAEKFGGTQALMSAYLTARSPLGPVAVLKFARIFDVTPTDIRPEFAFALMPGDLPKDVVETAMQLATLPEEVRRSIAHTVDLLSHVKHESSAFQINVNVAMGNKDRDEN